MRTRSLASLVPAVSALSSLVLAAVLAACSSAGTNADPSFDNDSGEDNGDNGDPTTGSKGTNSGGGDESNEDSGGGSTGSGDGNGNGNGNGTSGGNTGNGGGGTTLSKNDWTNVYATLFAPKTAGHCGNSGCHEVERHGFSCGTTADDCYQGLIAAGLLDSTNPAASDIGDAKNSPLSWFTGEGMPEDAPAKNAAAVAQITAWLAAGAPNGGVVLGGTPDTDAGTGGGDLDAGDNGDATTSADGGIKDAGKDSGSKDAGKDAGHDAGKDSGTDGGKDAGKDAGHDAGPAESWTGLYDAYFAAGTAGHCGNSGCHSSTKAGFKCGSTAASCYSGMVAAGLIDTANPTASDLGNPANTPLSWFGQGGGMPEDDQQNLPAGVAAIQAWLAAGAPSN